MALTARFAAHVTAVTVMIGAAALTGHQPAAAAEPLTITDRVAAVMVPPLEFGSVTATCEKGEEAVGGGYGVEASRYTEPLVNFAPANLFPVLESYPSSTTSWTVRIFNRNYTDFWVTPRDVLVTAHVQCVSTSVGTQIVSGPVAADPPTTISCPPKSTAVTGGGWRITGMTHFKDVLDIVESRPTYPEQAWLIDTLLPQGSVTQGPPVPVIGYAVCASRSLTPRKGELSLAVAPDGPNDMATDGTTEMACAKGELLTSAGHRARVGEFGITTFFPRYGAARPWVLTIYSLPRPYVKGIANLGAEVAVQPVCVTVS
jgi:hypothetical protein